MTPVNRAAKIEGARSISLYICLTPFSKTPGEWRWSGYRFYALGEPNLLLEPHPTFLGLSNNEEIRRKAFANYVNMSLGDDHQRRPDLSDARYIGSEKFAEKLGLSTDPF